MPRLNWHHTLAILLLATTTTIAKAVHATAFRVAVFASQDSDVLVRLLIENEARQYSEGKVYYLTLSEDDTVWSVEIPDSDLKGPSHYIYGLGDMDTVKWELATRTLSEKDDSSVDLFGEVRKAASIPNLPQLEKAWSGGNSKMFDAAYIPTVHISIQRQGSLEELIESGSKVDELITKFSFIGPEVYHFSKDVRIKVGEKNSEYFKKKDLDLMLPSGVNFDGRKRFKLRAQRLDPTFQRERISIDMSNSLGLPTYQGVHVHLYVDGQGFGIYFLTDSFPEGSVASNNNLVIGMEAADHLAGNLIYRGNDVSAYTQKHATKKYSEKLSELIPVMKVLHDIRTERERGNKNDGKDIAKLEKILNLDLIFRHAALEFLTLRFDGSWAAGSNYYMSRDGSGRWFTIAKSLENSLGLLTEKFRDGVESTIETFGKSLTKSQKSLSHPLYEVPLSIPKLRNIFESKLRDIIEKLFNVDTMLPRIVALQNLLWEKTDGKWAVQEGERFSWPSHHLKYRINDIPCYKDFGDGSYDYCRYGIFSYIETRSQSVLDQLDEQQDIENVNYENDEDHINLFDDDPVKNPGSAQRTKSSIKTPKSGGPKVAKADNMNILETENTTTDPNNAQRVGNHLDLVTYTISLLALLNIVKVIIG